MDLSTLRLRNSNSSSQNMRTVHCKMLERCDLATSLSSRTVVVAAPCVHWAGTMNQQRRSPTMQRPSLLWKYLLQMSLTLHYSNWWPSVLRFGKRDEWVRLQQKHNKTPATHQNTTDETRHECHSLVRWLTVGPCRLKQILSEGQRCDGVSCWHENQQCNPEI